MAEELNRGNGKIGRLPFERRTAVNRLLRDNASNKTIQAAIQIWKEAGERDADGNEIEIPTDQNIYNWKQGGYAAWLRSQTIIEREQEKAEQSREFAERLLKDGHHIADANELTLSSRIHDMLDEFDYGALQEAFAEKPLKFLELAGVISGQSAERSKRLKVELELQKYKDAAGQARAEMQKLRDPSKALNEAERNAIIDQVDQILGLKK